MGSALLPNRAGSGRRTGRLAFTSASLAGLETGRLTGRSAAMRLSRGSVSRSNRNVRSAAAM
ncbi:MAG: hypothetical protein JO228_09765 [Xanthobacteraceae bacterium]|nr:hypothetical protein [Xanthobacteraceae bacterium]